MMRWLECLWAALRSSLETPVWGTCCSGWDGRGWREVGGRPTITPSCCTACSVRHTRTLVSGRWPKNCQKRKQLHTSERLICAQNPKNEKSVLPVCHLSLPPSLPPSLPLPSQIPELALWLSSCACVCVCEIVSVSALRSGGGWKLPYASGFQRAPRLSRSTQLGLAPQKGGSRRNSRREGARVGAEGVIHDIMHHASPPQPRPHFNQPVHSGPGVCQKWALSGHNREVGVPEPPHRREHRVYAERRTQRQDHEPWGLVWYQREKMEKKEKKVHRRSITIDSMATASSKSLSPW